MKKLLFLVALVCFPLFYGCDSSNDPAPVPQVVAAGKASNLILDDLTNNGDASDFEVSFAKASDESTVNEYRIVIVNAASSGLTLESASALSADSYIVVAKSGSDVVALLSANLLDSDGTAIVEGNTYFAQVLSMADGTIATENSLSSASNSFELAQTTVKITYLQNDGVMISDGTFKVIIDALFNNATGWIELSTSGVNSLTSARSPYDQANVLMVTHNHGDHYNPASVNSYLSASLTTSFISTPQVVPNIASSSQVFDVSPDLGDSAVNIVNGVEIEVLNITHFNPQDGTNFANTVNYAFIVHLGGLKILHIGDGDLNNANFESFNLKDQAIDVALIPTFVFSGQLTQSNRDVLIDLISPQHIIGLHLATATLPSQVTALYPEARVFSTPLEFARY